MFAQMGWASRTQLEEGEKPASTIRWICDSRAPSMSSEKVAEFLDSYLNTGIKSWEVWVGPPDGWSREERVRLKYDQCWSFGALTLPHELAAVVAAEQIYRAWSIVKKLPYHLGH